MDKKQNEQNQGYTFVIDNNRSGNVHNKDIPQVPSIDPIYRDIPVTSIGLRYDAKKKETFDFGIPEKIKQMRRMYRYTGDALKDLVENFYRQGSFMADYEDEAPVQGTEKQYFTTYHDLNIPQLRWYFTWRKYVRRGQFRPVGASYAYMYIYELLCGIGTVSAQEVIDKLKDFKNGYFDCGIADMRMKRNLERWMYEYCILHGFPKEETCEFADPEVLERDNALSTLKNPKEHTDEEIFSAIIYFSDKKLLKSPVVNTGRGINLFAGLWKYISDIRDAEGKTCFEIYFGNMVSYTWYPLSNAIYFESAPALDMDYELDDCRSYHLRNGVWEEERYEKITFNKDIFMELINEADRLFRKELKTGRYINKKDKECSVTPYIEEFLVKEKREKLEAARPKIVIDFSDLDRIRKDAIATRDSLLTEEEMEKENERETRAATKKESEKEFPDYETNGKEEAEDIYLTILRKLLSGEQVEGLIRAQHLMQSIVADTINEKFFDEIGDNILFCDGSGILVVEDYREDIVEILSRES